ncbi:hypothetical protein [Methanosarcina mazei]|uniref:DNA replication complex GINS family protein n=1 Tax=Methanosarcina mazei TaxID=2209 RepID=A0A0F8J5N4_METMZ|nr:hypothetical protein [Methanosarcina mazei]KKG70998.1 hypothetical protein DU63_05835 [Methanosarcina mazei]
MECEDISIVLKNEKESKEITSLSSTFYEDAKRYLQELEQEIKKCANHKSKEYSLLSNELDASIGRIEDIFSLRMNKIYLMAAQYSNLSNIQNKNYNRLLPEEKRLYDSLIQLGERLKTDLLDPIVNQGKEPEQIQDENKQECVLVRILKDIPTFAGADGRSYTVKAEDTVMLPVINAEGLIKRNIAQIINTRA